MEPHLLQHIRDKLTVIDDIIGKIEQHVRQSESSWYRYNNALDSPTEASQEYIYYEGYIRDATKAIEQLRVEIRSLLSKSLEKPIESYLNAILELIGAIKAEYSKGSYKDEKGRSIPYRVDKIHILEQTRRIKNNMTSIREILTKYVI